MTGGTRLVRLANGTVENQFYTTRGKATMRTYERAAVPIDRLNFRLILLQHDFLIFPKDGQGSYVYDGLTFVCDNYRHLVCWPYSLDNLHLMAEKLNLKRCWFHKTHYDIPKSRWMLSKQLAIVSPKQIVRIIRGNIGAIASDVATSWQTLVASLNAPGAATS